MNRITIASISPVSHTINRGYGTFHLRGCKPGEPYTTLEITDQTDHKRIVTEDLKAELIPVSIPAQVVADDFLRTERVCFEPGNEGEHEGIFQCALESGPLNDELANARAARRAYLVKCVQHGDGIFGRVGARGIEQIPDFCKRAVLELQEKRPEWVYQASAPKIQCEGCGEMVGLLNDGTPPALCGKCGAFLDKEKAIRLGLLPAPEPVKAELEPVEVGKRHK